MDFNHLFGREFILELFKGFREENALDSPVSIFDGDERHVRSGFCGYFVRSGDDSAEVNGHIVFHVREDFVSVLVLFNVCEHFRRKGAVREF